MFFLVMKECGLLLRPNEKWDGSEEFLFTVHRRSDSDCVKDPSRRSVRADGPHFCVRHQ